MEHWHYSETYYITSADTDAAYHYKASAIFVLMQKAISEHARLLELSRDAIIAKYNCCWMSMRSQLKIHRPMIWSETVEARTIIRKPNGNRLHWDCLMYIDDQLVAESTTVWGLVNLATKKTRPIEGLPEFPTEDPEGALTTSLSRIEFPELELHDERKLYYSDTDINGHLNNTRYIDLACDAAELHLRPHGVFLKELLISYVGECFAGETIQLYRGKENGYLYIHGAGPDGSDRFDVKIKMSSDEGL